MKIHFRAFDPEGDLLSFAMYGYYGGPATPPMNLLPAGMGVYPGAGLWNGVADQWIDCPMRTSAPIVPVFPPVSCAYQIRLSATPRVTNGYSYIGYSEVTTHVTFRRPGVRHSEYPSSWWLRSASNRTPRTCISSASELSGRCDIAISTGRPPGNYGIPSMAGTRSPVSRRTLQRAFSMAYCAS